MVISRRGRSLGRGSLITFLRLRLLRGVSVSLVLAVLLHEVGQIFHSPATKILNRRVFGASGEQLDSGKASDGLRDIVGSSIDLGNGDLGAETIGIKLGKRVVLRSETVCKSWLKNMNMMIEGEFAYALQCPHQGA